MKKLFSFVFIALILILNAEKSSAQKKIPGTNEITATDMSSYVTFISSPLLKGRANGEPGLDIAQQYIISEAKLLGLKPGNGNSYLQPYTVVKKSLDPLKTAIKVSREGKDSVEFHDQVFQLIPTGPSDFRVSGDLVFAGYGLNQSKFNYNDYDKLETANKILLVMMGAPKNANGKYVFEGIDWNSSMGIQVKLTQVLFSRARAIMIVMDPKSGFQSLDQQFAGIAGQLNSSMTLNGEKDRNIQFGNLPKILFISRKVADGILEGSGHSLADLQDEIDNTLKPHSFAIPGKQVTITEGSLPEEVTMNNVAAMIEGSDPVLKNEYLVFSCHADHIGTTSRGINSGADDNATGCAALLSMAKAFTSLDKKPLRSILFLWFSGEEVGLFGSQSYTSKPLVPLNMTVADLNMDMIGRVKGVADTSAENPMTGPKKVFVITDNQSKELIKIADDVDKVSDLDLDYSLSGRNHPLQLFARSDHFNFVKKDIPVLFFTTGLHTDYHTPGDVVERIDFAKMELVTRTMYQIGYNVANRKTRIAVDNPYSKW
jgi:hypothetical protein